MSERLFCERCGNLTEFVRHYEKTTCVQCDNDCDEYGHDNGREMEGNVLDTHEGNEYFKCGNCGENVEFLSEDYIDDMNVLHTEKDGCWSNDELPENERNTNLVKALVAKRL